MADSELLPQFRLPTRYREAPSPAYPRLIPCIEAAAMTPDFIKVVAMPDYFIVAEFEAGEVRCFDMRSCLDFPAHAALKESGLFMPAPVEHGTVMRSEEIDLPPDTLYLRGLPG